MDLSERKRNAPAGTAFPWSEARFIKPLVMKSDLLLVPESICCSGYYMFWKHLEF